MYVCMYVCMYPLQTLSMNGMRPINDKGHETVIRRLIAIDDGC